MLSLRLYRFLLKFYPATFRENYAGPLEREFLDEYGDSPTRLGLAKLWLNTLADFSKSVPLLLAREFSEDARHAVRMWIKRPLPVVMAILALAIGIGANIGVFSVIDSLMLRSLPFRDTDRLVALQAYTPDHVSPQAFHNWRKRNQYLDNAAIYLTREVNLSNDNTPARAQLSETSWNLFEVLGAQPRAGRLFIDGEDEASGDQVAVISYGLWQQLFAGESRAIGTTLTLNGVAFQIIGVAPPGFDYPNRSDIWTPTMFHGELIPQGTGAFFWKVVGRLKDGMSHAAAAAAFDAQVRAEHPNVSKSTFVQPSALVPLRDELIGNLKQPSLILSAAVALLLLIACANVANLLLSRTAERADELDIRAALGASRARLIQQLLSESLVLAVIAGAVSVVFARWAVAAAIVFQPGGSASMTYTLANWRVAAFAIGIALLSGLLFGTAPALFAGGSTMMLRTNAQRPFVARLRSILVAAEIGLAVILIAAGAALGHAFGKLMSTDIGFDTSHLVSLRVSLAEGRYEKEQAAVEYYNDAIRRVRELDGVVSAGASSVLPLGVRSFSGFTIDDDKSMVVILPAGPGFFSTIGTRVVAGREFLESDRQITSTEKLVVVSESYARHFAEGPRSMVGRIVTSIPGWKPARVVGVVRDIRFNSPAYGGGEQVFPWRSAPTNFVIRVKGDPRQHIAAIRNAVQSTDPQIPVHDVMTMDERLAQITARPRFYTLATAMFGGCALLLSIVGLFGMISHSVTQRTRELGIRMALGTTPAALRLMLIRQGLVLVALGSIPGVIVTLFAAQWLQELVNGASEAASVACLISVVAIAALAALSTWTATSGIANLDPSAAINRGRP